MKRRRVRPKGLENIPRTSDNKQYKYINIYNRNKYASRRMCLWYVLFAISRILYVYKLIIN